MKPRTLTTLALAVCVLGVWWLWAQRSPRPATATTVKVSSSSAASEPVTIWKAPSPPSSIGSAGPSTPLLERGPLPEGEYLRELEALSLTDKQAALLLVEQGEQWYPSQGRAAEARRAMRVTLLVDLGRMPEARKFTREFIEQYPTSSYRPLVQGVTGIHPRPSGPGNSSP